jgi:hypothetical protein
VQEVVCGAGRDYVRGWLCGKVVQGAVVRGAKSRKGGTALGRVVDNIPRYTLTTRYTLMTRRRGRRRRGGDRGGESGGRRGDRGRVVVGGIEAASLGGVLEGVCRDPPDPQHPCGVRLRDRTRGTHRRTDGRRVL